MDFIEVTGKTVEDALTEASIKLGVPSTEIEYEVVNSGSNGFLGIGSKNAVIKAKKKEAAPVAEEKAPEVSQMESQEAPAAESASFDFASVDGQVKQFLSDVFAAMHMEVEIITSFDAEDNSIDVELKGDDMGILIGKRGQTLDSLQYLTNLAINKKAEGYVKVKIDTEDYRKRRKETLENLAKNIAYKVKKSRRPISLEPMNPFERRIIHSALQNDRYVTTHSEGEEPFRHVVVTLKR